MAGTDVARYACDYCRQKKFRCTREFPKCGACKPWPGPCNYSRDIPNTGTSSTTTAALASGQKPDDIQFRLQNLETAIQGLTDIVNKAVVAINEISSISMKDNNAIIPTTSADNDDQSSRLSVGKQNSFAVLDDATNSVHRVTRSLHPSLQQSAATELQFLSTSLTTAVDDNRLRRDSFYVPPRPQGYQLIGKFLESVCLGDAFFVAPSEEQVIQVIFDPERVLRKAWIVYIDYMILAMLSEDQSTEAKGFRNNVKLALNDSKIFLEPHLVHLQALILLAIHGEDYASPSLSWMLVGHACRQAEALGLHLSNNLDFETYQRRLSLFWMLFAVEKSCSLAFGRPSLLPSNAFPKVELPQLGHLTRFQPRSESTDGQGLSSVFGAHMFLARMKLARLTGDVLDLINSAAVGSRRDQLKMDLIEWQTQTKQLLNGILDAERASSSSNQLREMSLGMSTMNFEYLHIFMVLTRADASCVDSRLDAAREAISLLPSLFQLLAPLCERLKNVANVFHRLVVILVDGHGTSEQDKDLTQSTSDGNALDVSNLDNYAVKTFEDIQVELGDETGVDLRQYLEWLPADVFTVESVPLGDVSAGVMASETLNNFVTGVQEDGSRGTKRPFDVMFDWFSWDYHD
ncbi:hypothetical protein FPOAC1_011371 [Fusarium poae]|uniref:hypothetical protein n=1 Tax=Fusarium poae TaxID=36050 RepID=UPI001CEA6353|nr:hypothetical protein FPOAC1_011371 [Fusarium poae]KAG8666561.1 hypothetical protein FPOAC1_011371 [Fusarium poae]